jgi:hypothetical protein
MPFSLEARWSMARMRGSASDRRACVASCLRSEPFSMPGSSAYMSRTAAFARRTASAESSRTHRLPSQASQQAQGWQ